MKSYPNIDRSAFRRGEYVAYAGLTTFRVRRVGQGWQAYHVSGLYAASFTRPTLGAISADAAACGAVAPTVGEV
jgi:hypothetical protein